MKYSLRVSIAFFTLLCIYSIPQNVSAEIKIYTHTVKQSYGGSMSLENARIVAIARAKREVLEEAGTYLETNLVVKDHKVEKDDIIALSAGILKTKIISEKRNVSGATSEIIIKARVEVDTSILDKSVKAHLQNRTLLLKYKEIKNHEKKLLARVNELENKNEILRILPQRENEKERLKNQFREITQSLNASDLTEKALALWEDGKWQHSDTVLKYLTQAIRLNPEYMYAYDYRGALWSEKGNYDKAISDFSKAIELAPRYPTPYFGRGLAWDNKGNYDRAISDYNKAIELNPKVGELDPIFAIAYFNRGVAWGHKGNYDSAISDYNKALQINPKDTSP